jgi:elongation factor P
VTYSYFADPMYIFMDADYEQYEVEKENMGDAINYLEDGMEETCEVVFYNGKAISVELPNTVVRDRQYTEPAVKGDTSGKVMKPAKICHRLRIARAAFVEIGDKIEIDTRTDEYKNRVKPRVLQRTKEAAWPLLFSDRCPRHAGPESLSLAPYRLLQG